MINNTKRKLLYEEFMKTPFKTGGNGEPYYIENELGKLNRVTRRWLMKELAKGRKPSFDEIWMVQMGEKLLK